MSRRPSICMLLRSDFTHNLRVRKQAQTLAKNGWDVTVIALAVGNQASGLEKDRDGFSVWRIPNSLRSSSNRSAAASTGTKAVVSRRPKRSPFLIIPAIMLNRVLVMLRMVAAVRKFRPDVVEAHNVNVLPAGLVGSRLTGAKLVYDAHEINTERENYYARIRPLIYLVERVAVPRASLVISTTDMRAEHYQKLYRLKEKPLVIQNRPWFTAAERNDGLRHALSIPAEKVIVLYQGGLQPGRGLHNLVRVAAKVQNAAFVFLGNGSQRTSLESLAREMNVEDRVYFHSAVSLAELPAFTASADIGVQVLRNTCLNHYTTDSNKIFEYGMAGLAVVASDFPEIRKIIEQSRYGVLVDPGNLAEITGALQRLVDDRDYRMRLQANAMANRQALSWESLEPSFVGAFARLVPAS